MRLLIHDASHALICQSIEAGADIHTPETYSRALYTPFQFAVLKGRLDIAQELLSRGADIETPGFYDRHAVLRAACHGFGENGVSLSFIPFLLENGAKINARGRLDKTALQCAVKRGSIDLFCFLLDAGANFHATTYQSYGLRCRLCSVLDEAAWWGRLDMVDILIRKGAQSAIQDKGPYSGAIELARERGYLTIVEVLTKFPEQAQPTSVTEED